MGQLSPLSHDGTPTDVGEVPPSAEQVKRIAGRGTPHGGKSWKDRVFSFCRDAHRARIRPLISANSKLCACRANRLVGGMRGAFSLKDVMQHMEHPFYSLSKKGEAIAAEAERLGITQGQLIELLWEQYTSE